MRKTIYFSSRLSGHLSSQLHRAVVVLVLCSTLSGCGIISLAAAGAGAVVSVTGAVVSTGVKVTGKVIEKTVDAVTPDSTPEPAK
jgi:hypothetical protein